MSHSFPPSPADWFALIIKGLTQCLGRCVGPNPRAFSGLPNPSLPDSLLTLIWERLQRLRNRFAKRLARHPLNPPRPRAVPPADPNPATTDNITEDEAGPVAAKPPRPKTGAALLPRNFAWLLRLIQETAIYREKFQYLLADPDIMALLAKDPQLCRILRPLCHALGLRRDQTPSLWPTPPPPSDAPPDPADAPEQAAQAAFPPRPTPPDAPASRPVSPIFCTA